MTIEEFQKFIDEQDALFRTKQLGYSERERILARTVKLSEELGELSDEVLTALGDQRTGKMEERSADGLADGLADEFADVVIVAFLLAKSMNVDVMQALGRKVEKIRAKHNKQL